MTCAVCGSALGRPVYRSGSPRSLTSLCVSLPRETTVYCCGRCGHIQSPVLEDLDAYYASDYRILLGSADEDQLYEVVDGRATYRSEHQARVFLEKVHLPEDAAVLDFGAAKGATARHVLRARPDLRMSLFDVSDMYVSHWDAIGLDRTATFDVPQSWEGTFDAVVSFFMLEHVERPEATMEAQHELLRPGGVVYVVVPNVDVNIADFIVVDHPNHFTASSLEHLLVGAGFTSVTVDDHAHLGALVASGTSAPDGAVETTTADPQIALNRARELADYWTGAVTNVAAAEREIDGRPAAVYGAGFYGSFIHTTLASVDHLVAFVDQNPHLHGTEHLGLPVIPPDALPPEVEHVLVGLNPMFARGIIEGVAAWQARRPTVYYL